MTLRIRRLGYALGAEVPGVDLREPLEDPGSKRCGKHGSSTWRSVFPIRRSPRTSCRVRGRFEGELERFVGEQTVDPDDAGS